MVDNIFTCLINTTNQCYKYKNQLLCDILKYRNTIIYRNLNFQ